uniref:Uncharacterized protein n=1 Tax=Pipistrellus kuhlii TaxID=59472 RepID=A0A7J7R2G8_PIPKU|nr:hypothetical protein mPipKuh1_007990 [Pipistrellus kuhlii]
MPPPVLPGHSSRARSVPCRRGHRKPTQARGTRLVPFAAGSRGEGCAAPGAQARGLCFAWGGRGGSGASVPWRAQGEKRVAVVAWTEEESFQSGVQGHRECLAGGTVMPHGEGPSPGANPSLLPSSSLAGKSPELSPAAFQPAPGPGEAAPGCRGFWAAGGRRGGRPSCGPRLPGGGQGPEQHQSGRKRRGPPGKPAGGQAEPGSHPPLLPTRAIPWGHTGPFTRSSGQVWPPPHPGSPTRSQGRGGRRWAEGGPEAL